MICFSSVTEYEAAAAVRGNAVAASMRAAMTPAARLDIEVLICCLPAQAIVVNPGNPGACCPQVATGAFTSPEALYRPAGPNSIWASGRPFDLLERDQGGAYPLLDHLTVDDDPPDVVPGGEVVHRRE